MTRIATLALAVALSIPLAATGSPVAAGKRRCAGLAG
jgi:hypothetical protein